MQVSSPFPPWAAGYAGLHGPTGWNRQPAPCFSKWAAGSPIPMNYRGESLA